MVGLSPASAAHASSTHGAARTRMRHCLGVGLRSTNRTRCETSAHMVRVARWEVNMSHDGAAAPGAVRGPVQLTCTVDG